MRGEGCGIGLLFRFRRGDSRALVFEPEADAEPDIDAKAGGLEWSEETLRARRGEWRTGSRSSSFIFFSGGIWPECGLSSVAGVPHRSAGRMRLCLLKYRPHAGVSYGAHVGHYIE